MLLRKTTCRNVQKHAPRLRRTFASAGGNGGKGSIRPLRRRDYRESDFLLPRVDLSFDLESPDRASVHSRLYFSRQEHAESADLVLDGDADIDLQSIYVGEIKSKGLSFGRSLAPSTDYVLSDDKLTIHSDALPDASEFTIDTHVEISPKKNLSFAGLYMDGGGSFITQCEAHGFRRITYSLDRPDVLSEYLVSLTADKGACPVLLSNGNLVHSEEHEDGRHTTL